ncbi:alpha-amylase [Poseidonibacter lekithochrous]|nr:alpha-amylase [Poseidonibacter lekithochrous]
MSSNKNNNNHKSNQANVNKGTSGTNSANAKVHGNRGSQMNPNIKAPKGK